MTLDELSLKSGVSKRMISAYEKGENDITFNKLQNIAMGLDVSIIELISDEDHVLIKKFSHLINIISSDNITKEQKIDFKKNNTKTIDKLQREKEQLQKTIDLQAEALNNLSSLLKADLNNDDAMMNKLIEIKRQGKKK